MAGVYHADVYNVIVTLYTDRICIFATPLFSLNKLNNWSVTNLRSYHCDFTIVTILLLLNKDAS